MITKSGQERQMIDDTSPAAPQRAPVRDAGALLLAAGRLTAAFGAAACCRPSLAARLARPWQRMASNRGVVRRASPTRPPSRCRYLSSQRRWRAALASPPSGGLRAECRVRKPDDHRFRNGRSVPRRGFGRARFHVRLSVGRDYEIHDHLSRVRHREGRDHANRRLPIFVRVRGLRTMLRPEPGDCCVFCSYGSVPCPPVQREARP
jgi:hypothetical protein